MKYQAKVYLGNSSIEPFPPGDLVSRIAEYSATEFSAGGKFGYRESKQTFAQWSMDLKERLVMPTSLMQIAVNELQLGGNHVQQEDSRWNNSRLEVDENFLAETRGNDRDFARAVVSHDRSQIESSGLRDVISKIHLIARLYPDARMLILLPSQQQVKDFTWHANKSRLPRVRMRSSNQSPSAQRCLVSTFQPFRKFAQSHRDDVTIGRDHNWDIILLPNALGSLGNVPQAALGSMHFLNCKVFSFVPPRARLSRRDEVLLTTISGRLAYRIPAQRVGTKLLWLDSPSTTLKPTATPLEWKRQAYWANNRRNEFVAAVARAFLMGNVPKLRKYGVVVAEGVPLVRGGKKPSVTVLVESSEHGREIQRLLGDATLYTLHTKSNVENQKQEQAIIVTVTCAVRRGLISDVIVVASGSPAQLGLEKNWPSTEEFDDSEVLVVDFHDGWNSEMHAAAIRRQNYALRKGWITVSSPQSPLKEAKPNAKGQND